MSSVWINMSSHGEIELIGAPRSVRFSSSIPTIICIHVVPHFDGVEITTSSALNAKRSHRALSARKPRYRRIGGLYVHPSTATRSAPRIRPSTTPSANQGPSRVL